MPHSQGSFDFPASGADQKRQKTDQSSGLGGIPAKSLYKEAEISSLTPEERKQLRAESMGWITESAIMPRKGHVIEGVGTGSLVELRAQLYRTQEEAKRLASGEIAELGTRAKGPKDPFARSNSGVQDRNKRDLLQLKEDQDGTNVRRALERKAEMYDRIRKGELPDGEEGGEKYSVDFLRKGFLDDEAREIEEERQGGGRASGLLTSGGKGADEGGTGGNDGMSHKALVREVNLETVNAREQASALKQQREAQAKRRQEKLRAAFAKKQAEKMKQQKNARTKAS